MVQSLVTLQLKTVLKITHNLGTINDNACTFLPNKFNKDIWSMKRNRETSKHSVFIIHFKTPETMTTYVHSNIIRCIRTVHWIRCLKHKCWDTLDHTAGIPARLHTSLNYLHTQSYTIKNMFPTDTMDQQYLKLQVIPKINTESHSKLWHNQANEGNSRALELASRIPTICAIQHGQLGGVVKPD
jgi:hypothetical protein